MTVSTHVFITPTTTTNISRCFINYWFFFTFILATFSWIISLKFSLVYGWIFMMSFTSNMIIHTLFFALTFVFLLLSSSNTSIVCTLIIDNFTWVRLPTKYFVFWCPKIKLCMRISNKYKNKIIFLRNAFSLYWKSLCKANNSWLLIKSTVTHQKQCTQCLFVEYIVRFI